MRHQRLSAGASGDPGRIKPLVVVSVPLLVLELVCLSPVWGLFSLGRCGCCCWSRPHPVMGALHMRSQSPKFSKEQDGQIQGHLLCQAQPMAADSPAQPPGQPQNRGKLPGMFSLERRGSLPPSPWRFHQLCFARGKQPQFGPFTLCRSLNPPMLQPWLCL